MESKTPAATAEPITPDTFGPIACITRWFWGLACNPTWLTTRAAMGTADTPAAPIKGLIGIDETQFFDHSIVDVCRKLASDKKRVIVAGLDTDYRGLPFGPMPNMMCEAEYVDKLRAICLECGDPASYSQRTSKDSDQVVIGEMDKYEARCRNCFQPPEGH